MKVSAKTFYEPLLVTLLELSGGKANTAVDHNEVYGPAAQRVNLEIDQFGDNPDGKPKVIRWMQEAVKALRQQHWVDSPAKGKWALTLPGVQEAQRLRSLATPLLEQRGPQPLAPHTPKIKGHPYHDDPHVRLLAAQMSPCIGGYSDKSPVCTTCPIQASCMNEMAVELSYCAELLERQRDQGEKVALRKSQPAGALSQADMGKARLMECTREYTCSVCGKVISQGSKAMWIPTARGRVFLHSACHRKMTQKEGP